MVSSKGASLETLGTCVAERVILRVRLEDSERKAFRITYMEVSVFQV